MLALRGGKLLTVAQGTIENGVILVEDGRIVAVGDSTTPVPAGAETVDVSGCWVTPGLIDAHTHISTMGEPRILGGRVEVCEITDPVTPHVLARDSLNPFDISIAAARGAGFTTCCTLPGSANIINGQGVVIKCRQALTAEDLILSGTACMKFALGENPKFYYSAQGKAPSSRMGNGAVLREALARACDYRDRLAAAGGDVAKMPPFDYRLQALLPVVEGRMLCRFHCHRADDIVTAVRVAEEFGLRYALEHVTEGHKIIPFLQEKQPCCVIGPLNVGPLKMELWELRLETPGLLEEAGIPFCLTQDSGTEIRFLRAFVGMYIARGLSHAAALRALTLQPARLLGLEQRLGTLEAGKDADLAVFDGDPFSNYTRCRMTMIDGRLYHD